MVERIATIPNDYACLACVIANVVSLRSLALCIAQAVYKTCHITKWVSQR